MARSVILLAILLSVVAVIQVSAFSFGARDIIYEEWEEFKSRHAKEYGTPQEEAFRMKIFMENKHKIAKHNQRANNGLHGYTLAMNHFGDMLHHEFVATMNGFAKNWREAKAENGSTFITPMGAEIPAEQDWRKHGAVTPVKDQGQCGSCWAFSTTGALEAQHFRKTGQLVSLSEQNLVDCSARFGNNGCEGGLMDNAFKYIRENHGIDTEQSYPYRAKDGRCHFKKQTIGATDSGYVDVPEGDEEKLKQALATVGPVSVAIDASHETFQFYKSGVYDEPECSSQELDHGVLAVGYGTQAGEDYWIIKNSWSEKWGEHGYVRMARNKQNMCGVASSASYPLV